MNNVSKLNICCALLVHRLRNYAEQCERNWPTPVGLFMLLGIVHEAMNGHAAERDGFDGVVHVVQRSHRQK